MIHLAACDRTTPYPVVWGGNSVIPVPYFGVGVKGVGYVLDLHGDTADHHGVCVDVDVSLEGSFLSRGEIHNKLLDHGAVMSVSRIVGVPEYGKINPGV